MDKFRKSIRESFRRKKHAPIDTDKPIEWQADELAVQNGHCTFQVKYLGCTEVFESRGMQVCEEAFKILKRSKKKSLRAVLHISGDVLRVIDKENKGLIVDQTIEKVSFCAPDRNYDRGFSYICRDGATRRWMCHGFMATKYSGERLSHAVGCAFAACLERKQARDRACAVAVKYDGNNKSSFTRFGSFATTSAQSFHRLPSKLPIDKFTTSETVQTSSNSTAASTSSFALIGNGKLPASRDFFSNGGLYTTHNTASVTNNTDDYDYYDDSKDIGGHFMRSVIPAKPSQDHLVRASMRERPKVKLELLRQASFRCPQLLLVSPNKITSSPFRKQLSLRIAEMPASLQRLNETYPNSLDESELESSSVRNKIVEERFETPLQQTFTENDDITNLCRQITRNFTDETLIPNYYHDSSTLNFVATNLETSSQYIFPPSRDSDDMVSNELQQQLNGYHYNDNTSLTYTTCSYDKPSKVPPAKEMRPNVIASSKINEPIKSHLPTALPRNYGSVRLKDQSLQNQIVYEDSALYRGDYTIDRPRYELPKSTCLNPIFKRSYSTRNPFVESHKILAISETVGDSPLFNKTFVNLPKHSVPANVRDKDRFNAGFKRAFTVDMNGPFNYNNNNNICLSTSNNPPANNNKSDLSNITQNGMYVPKPLAPYERQNTSTNPFLSNS